MPAIMAGIGAGAMAGGSFLQGQSANRAGRQARDWMGARTDEGYQRLLNLLYGPNAGAQAFSRPGQAAPTAAPGSLLGRLSGLADFGYGQGQDITRGYDAASGRLSGLAQGAEGMARSWGAGRGAIIRDDFSRSLSDANRRGDAALAAGGFNSPTVRAGQYAGNAAAIGREEQRALQDLSESQIDRQLGARTQRLNVEGGRESGRTGLMMNLLNQNLGLRRAPIDVELGAAQSSIANPWLGQNATSYFPGQSGLGGGLNMIGGGAAGYGAYQLGQQQQENLLSRLLGRMQPVPAGAGTILR